MFGLFSFTLIHAWKVVTPLHSKEQPTSIWINVQRGPEEATEALER